MMIPAWRAAIATAVSLAVAAGVAGAQTSSPIDRGSKIIAGSAGWSRTTPERGSAETSISLSPSVLYFVRPHLAVGGSLTGAYDRRTPVTSTGFGIGPEVRYYDGALTDRTLTFIRASLVPTWEHFKTDQGVKADVTTWRSDFGAGIAQLIATHVALNGEVFYAKSWARRPQIDDASSTSAFGLRFGLTAFVF